MHPIVQYQQALTRRHFFGLSSLGLGTAALASLLPERAVAAPVIGESGGLPDLPHFAPTAKRAIYLFMAGAPSQMDLFDYKEEMAKSPDKYFDVDLPDSVRMGQRVTAMTAGQERYPIAPSIFKFRKHGQSGAWVSELLPKTASMVDDLAIVRSVYTEAINHDPAITYICTGSQIPGRPSLGAWLSYGLGSPSRDLPSFIVLTTGRVIQPLYSRLWGAGFMPSVHQGVALRSQGDPILFLSNPTGMNSRVRRRILDSLNRLNQQTFQQAGDPETLARIAQYEMAFRMQRSVPELTDISDEPQHVLDMYGPNVHKRGSFAASCLLARRMAERDVRFIQIFHRGWDTHSNVPGDLPKQCQDVDQPCWALIQDLKQRGLLEDTLVVWGGEFGRTIYCQGGLTKEMYGRDHHPRCFSIWLAGGGIKPGVVYGRTDEFSYNILDSPVHIHNLNATILHCLGIDHRRLTYKFQGLDMRLTGVEEQNPVKGILA